MPETVVEAPTRASAWMRWLAVSAAVIALDQWSKQQIVAYFGAHVMPLTLTSWFDLVLAYNKGAAFSLLNEDGSLPRILFSVVALAASVALVWLIRSQRGQSAQQFGAALILGGALGNLLDRIRQGAVVDFIQWHLGGAYWPAFNVADSAISVGAAILVLSSLRTPGAAR